jgi:hypothetical protein
VGNGDNACEKRAAEPQKENEAVATHSQSPPASGLLYAIPLGGGISAISKLSP